jgi:hypothetical protein
LDYFSAHNSCFLKEADDYVELVVSESPSIGDDSVSSFNEHIRIIYKYLGIAPAIRMVSDRFEEYGNEDFTPEDARNYVKATVGIK